MSFAVKVAAEHKPKYQNLIYSLPARAVAGRTDIYAALFRGAPIP
jgi:hypothetical protein